MTLLNDQTVGIRQDNDLTRIWIIHLDDFWVLKSNFGVPGGFSNHVLLEVLIMEI